jgi:hypothetical protein
MPAPDLNGTSVGSATSAPTKKDSDEGAGNTTDLCDIDEARNSRCTDARTTKTKRAGWSPLPVL